MYVRGLLRRCGPIGAAILLACLAPIAIPTAAHAAAGTVLLSGGAWFGGNGVPVCNPTWTNCGGQAPVGSPGQCVELAQRFYKARGWYTGIFPNVAVARQIWDRAPAMGMSRQAQTEIRSVVPGDMLVMNGGSTIVSGAPAGHVAVVDYISANADGTRSIHTINQNAKVVRQDARWHGGTVDSFWSDHGVIGIVHSPKNTGSATGPGGNNGYPTITNGGGTRLTGPNAYVDVSSAGQVYAWNANYYGGNPAGNTGITDVAAASGGKGYWMTDTVGHVYAYGSAQYRGGSPAGYSDRIVSIAAKPDASGYWLMSEAGQVYSYGARYYGGSPSGYSGKFVSIESTPSGNGYWMVTSAGQVYSYGDAQWKGNATGFQTAITSMSRTPGSGYVMVSVTGQVYAFGDAQYRGNVTKIVGDAADISYTLAGMSPGYVIITRSGQHYAFGGAPFIGNPTGYSGNF